MSKEIRFFRLIFFDRQEFMFLSDFRAFRTVVPAGSLSVGWARAEPCQRKYPGRGRWRPGCGWRTDIRETDRDTTSATALTGPPVRRTLRVPSQLVAGSSVRGSGTGSGISSGSSAPNPGISSVSRGSSAGRSTRSFSAVWGNSRGVGGLLVRRVDR